MFLIFDDFIYKFFCIEVTINNIRMVIVAINDCIKIVFRFGEPKTMSIVNYIWNKGPIFRTNKGTVATIIANWIKGNIYTVSNNIKIDIINSLRGFCPNL